MPEPVWGIVSLFIVCQAVGTKMTEDEISALFRKYDKSMDGKIDIAAEALGQRELKNIPRKVALHRLVPVAGPTPVAPAPDAGKASQPLAGKPSIVVLPFDNLSNDPEQDREND